MTNFEKDFWNSRYANGGHSGDGSYGYELTMKLSWLTRLEVSSILDFGCGDFNFGKNLINLVYPKATYHGVDVSTYIIEKNKALYPQFRFTGPEEIEPADLVLCIDVLFHIVDDEELENTLNILEKNWVKYLAITAYEYEESGTSGHVRIRKFDPSRFGTPIIKEIAEKEGSKYFYLFKK